MTSKYESPLSSRYASEYMLNLFSSDTRYSTWRRLWDSKTGEKLDKDRFRRDLGGVEDAYAEVMKRLTDHI